MVFALGIVSSVVRRRSHVDAAHIESLITHFLLPSPSMSLSDAIRFNSLELLDWIWVSSCTSVETRASTWTLGNYLRSDPYYYRWQFGEAMKVAIQYGNLQVVEWLFAHFSWCVVPIAAVDLAASKGNLDILKFLKSHDAGYFDYAAELDRRKNSISVRINGGEGIVVEWFGNAIRCALVRNHIDVALWLSEYAPYKSSKTLHEIARYYLEIGDFKKAATVLNGENLFSLIAFCSNPEIIEIAINRGCYTRQEERAAGRALRTLAREGRLDLIQRMVELYSSPPMHEYYWGEEWGNAMEEACRSDQFETLEYLMNHPTGRHFCEVVQRRMSDFICFAGRNGNLGMMQFISEHGAAEALDMRYAVATGGHVDVLKWYIERFPVAVQHSAEHIITTAARCGYFDILTELHRLDVLSRLRTCSSSSNIQEKTTVWWPAGCNAMDVAATHGNLDIVEWLHVHRSEKCSKSAMDVAAGNGHLDMVKWLHANRKEGCTTKAMDRAIGNGHIHVAEWLRQNRSEGFTADALDQAAKNGHLNAMKWLYENQCKISPAQVIGNAITQGHMLAARWLHARSPHSVPVHLDFSSSDVSIGFEALLFLHFHFPNELNPQVVQEAKKIFSSVYFGTSSDAIIVEWLEEKYPSQHPRDREHG